MRYIFPIVLFFYLMPAVAQETIDFTRHSKINNLLTGHKAGFELPVYAGAILTSDFEYESDGKSVGYFGVSPKFTLKNGWGRGIGLGVGLDYAPAGYLRANLLLDLDFLFAYDIPMNEKGSHFKPSMFTKFELSKIIARVDGQYVNEYYLSVNVMKMQFGRFAGEWGVTGGIMRGKFTPHFADKGMYYKVSCFIF